MRIAIGSDHRGVAARKRLVGLLERLGNEVVDCGSDGEQAVDYPDIAADVARRVSDGTVERGILLCCTGVGMSIAANRHRGVRAVVCSESYSATMSRIHNDANVLCFGARVVGPGVARQIVEAFVQTGFEGGRHGRRVAKIEPA